jgi:hypothetical protein
MKVVSLGTEVVVDHVEKHHQIFRMRGINEVLEVIWAPIRRCGRIGQYAVISPIAVTGKTRDWHDFDGCDAKISQIIELLFGGSKSAFRRKRADMQLVNGSFLPGPSFPVAVLPFEREWVDNLARAVNT